MKPTQLNFVSRLTHYSDLFWLQFGRLFNVVIHSWVFTLVYLIFPLFLIPALIFLPTLLLFNRLLIQESVLLEITPPGFSDKEALTTQNFFSVIHGLGKDRNLTNLILGSKTIFSLEIVSTLNLGIRYLVRTSPDEAEIIKKDLLSYYSQAKIKEVEEYLPSHTLLKRQKYQVIEFK